MRIIILLMLLLVSCTATKEVPTKNHTYKLQGKEVKSFNKSQKAYNINAQGSRVFSLYQFPTKDSVVTNIEYREGETKNIPGETKYVNCDSIAKANGGNAGVVSVPCPPSTHRVDTIYVDSTKYQIDNRDIDALKVENTKCEKELSEVQAKNSKLHNIILSLIIALAAAILIIIYLLKR